MPTMRGPIQRLNGQKIAGGIAEAVRAVTMPTVGLRNLQEEMRRSNNERVKLLRNLSRYNLAARQSTSRISAES